MGSTQSEDGLNSRQIQLIAVTTLCLVLSVVTLVLRLFARWKSQAAFWWDDLAAAIALVFTFIPNIFTLVGIKDGLGRHIEHVDPNQLKEFGITVWIQQFGWVLSIAAIIATILLFYVRLFPSKKMRWAIGLLAAWSIMWSISTFLVLIFQCKPVEFFYDKSILNGTCINRDAFYFASGVTSTITILVTLLLPLPVILKLHTTRAKKIGLAISFTAGTFVLVSSIVRLIVLLEIVPADLTYTSSLPQLWSCVEVSFGVISACIPSLTPLFFGRLGESTSNTFSHSDSSRYNPKSRSYRPRDSEFERLGGGSSNLTPSGLGGLGNKSEDGSQSLELIIQNAGKGGAVDTPSTDADGIGGGLGLAATTGEDLERGGIMVTKQVDQISNSKLDRTESEDSVGYAAGAMGVHAK